MPPPRKPSHLRAVEGNPSHARPINHDEPMPTKGFYPAPDYFSEQEKKWYEDMCNELTKWGVITVMDSRAVEMMITAYSEYRQLREEVAIEGYTIKTQNMHGELTTKANPAVSMMSDAWRRFRGMATEFGMTPASRSKVTAKTDEKEDDIIGDIMDRKRK